MEKNKQQIYHTPGIPFKTHLLVRRFAFFGKQRSRNEPWYMILLANMVLIAVKPKALTAETAKRWFVVYLYTPVPWIVKLPQYPVLEGSNNDMF